MDGAQAGDRYPATVQIVLLQWVGGVVACHEFVGESLGETALTALRIGCKNPCLDIWAELKLLDASGG